MHRIDAPGATAGNLFTEGNPSLSIPATQVSDDWLNDVQEEIVNVILDQGISLVKGTQNQFLTALQSMLGAGGVNYKLDPLQNNTADQVITGLTFSDTETKAAVIFYDIHRQTTLSNVQEMGAYVVTRDTADGEWRIEKLISAFDNSGCSLNITSAGQVRISSDDLAGASYAGQFRTSGVLRLAL